MRGVLGLVLAGLVAGFAVVAAGRVAGRFTPFSLSFSDVAEPKLGRLTAEVPLVDTVGLGFVTAPAADAGLAVPVVAGLRAEVAADVVPFAAGRVVEGRDEAGFVAEEAGFVELLMIASKFDAELRRGEGAEWKIR